MRHRISCCVFVMAAVAAFYGSVTAQSLNYSDAVMVPQVDSKMPQIDSELNHMVQTKEALDHGVCFDKAAVAGEDPAVRETIRGYLNGQGSLPESPNDALKDKTCGPLDYSKSYLHDFNGRISQICNVAPEARAVCYLLAVSEFLGALPQGTVLNAEGEHNIKIVCTGGEEYVFDKDGRIVDRGINEGTFNLSPPEDWVGHAFNDIIAAIQNLPEKSSLTRDEAIKALEERIRKRQAIIENSAAKTQKLFADGNTSAIDTPKLDAKSSQTKSNDVSDDSEKKSGVPEQKTVSNRVGAANSMSSAAADSGVGVRGWCKCPNRSANIVTGPLFRMGEDFNVADYSYFFCGDCYKCRKDFNDVADIIKDGTICIWDVKVARANGLDGKTIPDVKAQQQLSEAQDRIMQIPDGEVVIPGLCRCESPRIWLFGELPKRIEMCKDCGRPRSPIPLSAKNPRQPRKLRRCRKTSTSIFVCTCAGDTGVKPNIHASPYDDGDVELSLVCTKCSQVKYSAFVPVREFKKKFANGKPDPQAMLVYMIGTVDIKAAMLAADKEASSQN